MTAVKKLKPKIVIPSLKERAIALVADLRDAPSADAIEALVAISPELDKRLDVLAEARREKRENWAVPAGVMRNQWLVQGRRACKRVPVPKLSSSHSGKLTSSLHRFVPPSPARLWRAPDTGHNRALAAAP